MKDQNIVAERNLRVEVGDWDVNLVFRWEGDCWVCRMENDFLEDLLTESEGGV